MSCSETFEELTGVRKHPLLINTSFVVTKFTTLKSKSGLQINFTMQHGLQVELKLVTIRKTLKM